MGHDWVSEGKNRLCAAFYALILGVPFALSSCGWNDPGPRVRVHTGTTTQSSSDNNARANEEIVIDSARVHRVTSGETLYAISRTHGVSLKSLIVANKLQPPYTLTVGQRLVIPKASVHRVQRGETLYGISRKHGVSLDSLVRLNRIPPPYDIRVGQELYLPGRVASAETAPTRTSPRPTQPTTRSQPQSTSPSGNTIDATSAGSKRLKDDVANMEFEIAASGYPRPRLKPLPPSRPRAALPAPPARAGKGFLWPVKGRVLSGFGVKGKGLHNDGLNIAAPRGAPVRAAENGVVAYSGSELKGFGNMILLKHSGGYLTAYAHNAELLVRRGEVIRKGQTIAKVGSTGNVDSPQLHFQVRRKGKSVNPRPFLGS